VVCMLLYRSLVSFAFASLVSRLVPRLSSVAVLYRSYYLRICHPVYLVCVLILTIILVASLMHPIPLSYRSVPSELLEVVDSSSEPFKI